MSPLHRVVSTLAGVLLAASLPGESILFAAAPIVNYDPLTSPHEASPWQPYPSSRGMVGWSFQLLQPFAVTSVGWYDKDGDGLSQPFQVGLWEGQGSDEDPGVALFPEARYSSLIGDPGSGLIIPAGTNAVLDGAWRLIDLPAPVTLQPGFYQIGGLVTVGTTDVILNIPTGLPEHSTLTKPGSPLVIGPYFEITMGDAFLEFGPTPDSHYVLYWGLELGPMLFGSKVPPATDAGLTIRSFGSSTPAILLMWTKGTLMYSPEVRGPYSPVPGALSPYIASKGLPRGFYLLDLP